MKISILVPVFNKEQTLSQCLDSVINQIEPGEDRFEIVLVDDGSKDGSGTIIKRYADQYSFIKTYTQSNAGVSAARNTAIEIASGDYVLFLDADDELLPNSLHVVYDFVCLHSEIDMLVTIQTREKGDSERVVSLACLKEGVNYTGVEAYKNHYVRVNAGGGICRTEFLRSHNLRFPVGVRNAEDTIFFGLVQALSNSIMFLNLPLYRINETLESASRSNVSKLAKSHIITVQSIAEIRNDFICSEEQRGIIEFVTYQLVSNTISMFSASPDLKYSDFRKSINMKGLLPIKTKYMYIMKRKAQFLNVSPLLFYFIDWLKSRY